MKNITPYSDINHLLDHLTKDLQGILGNQLFGLYLTGSLTYGDFDRGSSDIDLLAILDRPLSSEQREKIKDMHRQIGKAYPIWDKRTEMSYITKDMLTHIEPPKTPRPYFNGGKLWDPDPPYGNEWLLNLYVLYECGIALIGSDPRDLISPIDIKLVREASRRDLLEDWQSKLEDPSDLDDSHFQAYMVMTLCRILHRAKNDGVASKKVASKWVKEAYGHPWRELIQKAENWKHGQGMNSKPETLDFLRFTVKEVERF